MTRDQKVSVARSTAFSILGSIVFLAVFTYHLKAVPGASYQERDDALITLSHARNLVEYGFIGVNPSGERVEGFSAPLQFWLSAAIYALAPFDYSTFFRWQVTLGTLALGASVAGLLLYPARRTTVWRMGFVALALLASAQVIADSRAFLLWHASGMENAYKSVGLVILLWALSSMLDEKRIRWSVAVLIPLVALTRTDGIVPVASILAGFILLWWLRYRNVSALKLATLGLVPWGAYMVWRWWYFGQWVPNTALAQRIAVPSRLDFVFHSPGAATAEIWEWMIDVGASLHAFQLGWIAILFIVLRRHAASRERALLLLCGAAACILQYTLFGPARLDLARTVTELAIYSALAAPLVLLGSDDFRGLHFLAGTAMLATSVFVVGRVPPDRTEVGWGAKGFDVTARTLEAIGREQHLPRPLVANADLGAVSWGKQLNVVDLGLLGSAIVPRLESPGEYATAVAAADIIEIHDAWSCLYRDLFTTPAFREDYVAVSASRSPWITSQCGDAPNVMSGIWIRRDITKDSRSAERSFMDAFGRSLDAGLLGTELAKCLGAAGARPCGYVGRTLYRFVPELKRDGRYHEVARLLGDNPRLRLEHAYFTSSANPQWWRDVLAIVQPISIAPQRLSFFALTDGSRSSRVTVTLHDPLRRGWRVVPPGELFDLDPRSGRGAGTLSFVARPQPGEMDRTVEVPVYSGDDTTPAKTLTVRFRAVAALGSAPPAGSVDAPPASVRISSGPVTFQGWAVDDFDLRMVYVSYIDGSGKAVKVAEAQRSGLRPDVAALFPNRHDLFNSGWTVILDARSLRRLPRPTLLSFIARGASGEAEIGKRLVVK